MGLEWHAVLQDAVGVEWALEKGTAKLDDNHTTPEDPDQLLSTFAWAGQGRG